MSDVVKEAPVVSPDVHASILAALARIEEVPAGKTLIHDLSDEDWMDADADNWNICVGAGYPDAADELDDCDVPKAYVA